MSNPDIGSIKNVDTIQRDLRIDTLRGLLLVMMTLNHTHSALLYSGWIQKLVVSPLGYVSAAEGFIFISGFVAGLVYMNDRGNTSQLISKGMVRGRTIYLHHLIPLYSLHLLAILIPALALSWEKWLSFYYLAKRTLVAEALLLYQPEIFDILPMFVIFVLVSPFLILACEKRWGVRVVLVFSVLLWGLGQKFDPLCMLNETLFPGHRCGWFNIFAWQLVYVLGLVLGYSKLNLGGYRFFRSKPFVIGVFATTLLFFLMRHQVIDLNFLVASSVAKKNLAWLRIVNLMVLVAFIEFIFAKLPRQAQIPGVAFLGQHSLQVFAFHVLLIYFITPFHEIIVSRFNLYTYPLFMLLVGASLLIPAFLHVRWGSIKQKLRTIVPRDAVSI